MKFYMFRTIRLSIIRSLLTVHSEMVYVIEVCEQFSRRTRTFYPGPAQKLSTNTYDIHHCWVYSEWTPDDGQTNCPKYVEFHDKMNLWNWCI